MKLKGKLCFSLMLAAMLVFGRLAACVPQINWGASISFCQGNSFTLSAFNNNSTYIWSTGATGSSIVITSSGTYWVQVTNACGSASDTIVVSVDQPMNINLGADRNICTSSPTVLKAPISAGATYLWSTGATSDSISVNQSGTYWVEATNACGTYSDTVVLNAHNVPSIMLGPDLNPCTPGPVNLALPAGISGSFLWSDGSTGSNITVNQSGSYWVRIANACGIFHDTITVTYLIQGQIFPSDTISLCTGGTLTLSTGVNATAYLWSNGSTNSSIQLASAGQVWVRLNTSCGQIFDTVHIISSAIASVNLGPDTSICASQPLNLDAGNPGSIFAWSTGESTQSIKVSTSGSYWVGVDNGCGFVYDTINIIANPQPVLSIKDNIYVCNGSNSPVQDAGFWGPNTQYLWSNGTTTRLGGSFPPGSHWVQVINSCDTVLKNFQVISVGPPVIDLGPDTVSCLASIVLDPGINDPGLSYLWSNGSNSKLTSVNYSGLHWVVVSGPCGSFSDSIIVILNSLPAPVQDDVVKKCYNSSKLIQIGFVPGTHYQWNTGDTTNYTLATSPGTYWVSAWHDCDTIVDSVVVIDEFPLNIDLGPDTLICSPSMLTYNFTSLNADSIIWDGSIRLPVFNATSTGLHWVEVYNSCGVFRDSIMVTVDQPPQKVLRDTAYCYNASVSLNAYQSHVDSYLWNTGDTASSIVVNQTGWYYVDMQNQCGSNRDSAFVRIDYNLPRIDLGPDTLFCAGTLTLDPGVITGAYYLWHNGDTSRSIDVSSTGTYYVQVYNACNSVWDTINVVVTGPPTVNLGNNVSFCRGSAFTLNAQNPGCTYLWNNGDSTQSITIYDPGVYWVDITNDCGSVTDSINVIVEDPLNTLNLGQDTNICRGDSILLDTKLSGVSTKWHNGSSTNSIYVKETGSYWVEVTNTCGTWDDTIFVTVLDTPVFDLGMDPALCSTGNGITINGPTGMHRYLWSTGDTTADLTVQSPGIYWLSASNECFTHTDTVRVTEDFPLTIDLGNDTTLCEGEVLSFSLNLTGTPYIIWSDGSTGTDFSVTTTGVYFVTAENACGLFSDTIDVVFDEYLNPDPVDLVVCRDDSLPVDLRHFDEDFIWSDGSTEKFRYFSEEGVYSIFISNRCGTFTKDYNVELSNCECPFYTANAFTPNDDGLNDNFVVTHSCDLTDFKIQIFNRWGKMVYEGSDDLQGWDGTYQGEPMPAGIYTYSLSYYWEVYGDRHMRYKTGTLTLVR